MTDICICPGRHSGHRLASPVTASRHTPSTRAVNGSTQHFTVPWAFSRLLLVESAWIFGNQTVRWLVMIFSDKRPDFTST